MGGRQHPFANSSSSRLPTRGENSFYWNRRQLRRPLFLCISNSFDRAHHRLLNSNEGIPDGSKYLDLKTGLVKTRTHTTLSLLLSVSATLYHTYSEYSCTTTLHLRTVIPPLEYMYIYHRREIIYRNIG